MSEQLLLGFADTPDLLGLPEGYHALPLGAICAVTCAAEGADSLQRISANLLKLQSQAAIVPLRPHKMPNGLPAMAEKLGEQLRKNFDHLGRSVEFVIELKLVEDTDVGGGFDGQADEADDPANYLRAKHEGRRAYQRAIKEMRTRLKPAAGMLESAAQATKLGERNVKDFAAIHYLMNRESSLEAVSQWQSARASLADIPATLAGPWAPYSFVSLDS